MSRFFLSLAVIAGVLTAGSAHAQSTTLVAASDVSQIEDLQVAKVMARDSSFWLGVHVRGKARVALVTADSAVANAPAADAWLRALDFTTRVRVAPPPGPRSTCGMNASLGLVDTGLPEPTLIDVLRVEAASSELELRRTLEDAGLAVDSERIARFTSEVPAPFRVAIYEAPENGGQTAALRLLDHENAAGAPRIEIAGRDAVPLSFIGLATAAVRPPEASSADPSEFAVTYRAASSTTPSSDYLNARASWLLGHPQRWLLETQGTASLFAWTVFPSQAQIAPAMVRYFQGMPGSCAVQVQDAQARGSQQAVDYQCGDHDDLSTSLAQLGFGELQLSRLYGSLSADGVELRVVDGEVRSPLLNATDIDEHDCATPTVSTPVSGGGTSSPTPQPPVVVSDPGPGGYYEPDPGTPVYTDDGNCNLVFVGSDSCNGDSSSSDSCSGDSSSSDSSSSDSCSGDSSADDGGPDSCSGDSSSNSSDDSCSGDSDSSSDSDGCGKSDGYDGDTCGGSSHSSAEATRTSTAELRSQGAPRSHRPRRVHLSLLTLFAAALALPFRRLCALRL